ncbi:MAG: cytochrome c3 family protein [Desulfobacterales bacterium]
MDILFTLTTLTILTLVALFVLYRYRKFLTRNLKLLSLSLLSAVLVVGFLYTFYNSPATDIGVEQPIPFSHRIHVNVKNIQCQFCHPYVGRSINPGLPPVEKCLYCHNYIIANFPPILKEHQYYNSDTPTPWKKANYLAEHVLFNHQRHIRKEIACQQCHGEIQNMDRIKGKVFFMAFCIKCHRERKANIDCWLACHS